MKLQPYLYFHFLVNFICTIAELSDFSNVEKVKLNFEWLVKVAFFETKCGLMSNS